MCIKNGDCGLYFDEQKDENIISILSKDLSKIGDIKRFSAHFRK